jgi:hypothetical protein
MKKKILLNLYNQKRMIKKQLNKEIKQFLLQKKLTKIALIKSLGKINNQRKLLIQNQNKIKI